MKKDDLVSFRNVMGEDNNFILSTWLRGLRYGNQWFGMIEQEVYFKMYKPIIERLLVKPTVSVKVACLKDDPEVILSYSVLEQDRLHWVFTKKAWRQMGLANDLIPKEIKTLTHITHIGESLYLKKKQLTFNPFLL